MAAETTELDGLRANTGADPELRAAERKVNDLIGRSGISGELLTGLLDYLDLAVAKAVERAISEMQGSDQANIGSDTAGRGQSAFVHDEQRLADSLAARIGKDSTRLQWRETDYRGRGKQGER